MRAGLRRDPRQALEEIQERPFGRQQFGRGAGEFGHHRTAGDRRAILDERADVRGATIDGEDGLEQA